MEKLYIATSPLTNEIFIGRVLRDGYTFAAGKQEVTGMACNAVCEHVIACGEVVIVSANGKPKYVITVKKL